MYIVVAFFAVVSMAGCVCPSGKKSVDTATTQNPNTTTDQPGEPGGQIGDACSQATDCESQICEGMGCDGESLGTCVSRERMCTMDLAPYCGCDGKDFAGSGSCPGRRYAKRGSCSKEDVSLGNNGLPGSQGKKSYKRVGESCLSTEQCRNGVCEGLGCGPMAPGVCRPLQRACTRDLVTYCGCDGNTFRTSGSCPGARYLSKGACQ